MSFPLLMRVAVSNCHLWLCHRRAGGGGAPAHRWLSCHGGFQGSAAVVPEKNIQGTGSHHCCQHSATEITVIWDLPTLSVWKEKNVTWNSQWAGETLVSWNLTDSPVMSLRIILLEAGSQPEKLSKPHQDPRALRLSSLSVAPFSRCSLRSQPFLVHISQGCLALSLPSQAHIFHIRISSISAASLSAFFATRFFMTQTSLHCAPGLIS